MSSKGLVVAAMSGGVDSAVAAALLVREGYEVIGITMQIWQENRAGKHGGCCSLGAVEDARRAAQRIGIPHYVLNMRDFFASNVIDLFVREYARGRTPNPCVECNRTVKFQELMRQARSLGARFLATGHYARIRRNTDSGRWELHRAAFRDKDQSYALYSLTQDQLASTLFPLGELHSKEETRRLAREWGLPLADKPDSQEICFVPAEGYVGFVREKVPEAAIPGPIVDTQGTVIGRHQGIGAFTIGQRRRLPPSPSGARYVVRICPDTNTVTVGTNSDLYASRFLVAGMNWVSIPELTNGSLACSARIRYNAEAAPARISAGDPSGRLLCEFETPQRAITPGQAAVFYDGDRVLGGGTIESVQAED